MIIINATLAYLTPLKKGDKSIFNFFFILVFVILLPSCNNNPYPIKESNQNIYYTAFTGEPKYLDPAMAYSSDEYRILSQIYEPPLQYHLLKRPYQLIPATLIKMPQVSYSQATAIVQTKVIYTLAIRQDIVYQNHPAFATKKDGKYIYHLGEKGRFPDIKHPNQLPHQSSHKLTAYDYAYQIKRMAHPKFPCPIFSILAEYIDGFQEFSMVIKQAVEEERLRRKKEKGVFYNQEIDEIQNPIYIDLRKYNLSGVRVVNEYTLQIILKKRYPQFVYWMAMPFFSPIPWEVDRFYNQVASAKQNLSLNRFPVGTGAYKLSINQPNYRMVLEKNSNFHDEFYPTEGSVHDFEDGYLKDAGKKLPFIDKVVITLEKESIPLWNKFLQGYYDSSAVGSDFFDSVISFSQGDMQLTKEMKEKEIKLTRSTSQVTYYYAFNMLDDVVGGYTPKKVKLRQALSIAFNIEEFIQVFLSNRGIPAQSPIPPEIFGYQEGRGGMNSFIYTWNQAKQKGERKKIQLAKKLLAEAGYLNGRTPQGTPLVLYYDNVQGKSGEKAEIDWLRKQFKKLGIDLQIRSTDYNQFRRKVSHGNFQIMRWGWHADYPDPENFLFLLYGPNGKVASGGENASNYNSPAYNRLFKQMETMKNTALRLSIIRKIINIARKDAPWMWGFHPIEDVLHHSWYQNTKVMQIGSMNTTKYRKIDFQKRKKYRDKYNTPVLYPVWIGLFLVLLFFYFMGQKKMS